MEPPSLLRRASAAAAAATVFAPSRLIVFLSVTWPPWPPWPQAGGAAAHTIRTVNPTAFHGCMVVLLVSALLLRHFAKHLDHAVAVLEVFKELHVVLEPPHGVCQQPIEPPRVLERCLGQILYARFEVLAVGVH